MSASPILVQPQVQGLRAQDETDGQRADARGKQQIELAMPAVRVGHPGSRSAKHCQHDRQRILHNAVEYQGATRELNKPPSNAADGNAHVENCE